MIEAEVGELGVFLGKSVRTDRAGGVEESGGDGCDGRAGISSSAVIILSIVFINAKALTFKQAIGIIMGANIGTTFSSQLKTKNTSTHRITS